MPAYDLLSEDTKKEIERHRALNRIAVELEAQEKAEAEAKVKPPTQLEQIAANLQAQRDANNGRPPWTATKPK